MHMLSNVTMLHQDGAALEKVPRSDLSAARFAGNRIMIDDLLTLLMMLTLTLAEASNDKNTAKRRSEAIRNRDYGLPRSNTNGHV
jgi:hypothetical protein